MVPKPSPMRPTPKGRRGGGGAGGNEDPVTTSIGYIKVLGCLRNNSVFLKGLWEQIAHWTLLWKMGGF